MGFERFGKTGYISQAKITPFLSYLEKGELSATRCTKCGKTYFPPRADCANCESNIVEWIQIKGTGKLVTFTEVFFAPPQFQSETPYLLGVAELDSGLRVFAPISREVQRSDLKPGLALVLRPKHSGESVFYQLEKKSASSSEIN